MSEENVQDAPSQADIRAARHAGFDASVAGMADERKSQFTTVQRASDARREKNVADFYNTVLGESE